jgi:hypothetical protein
MQALVFVTAGIAAGTAIFSKRRELFRKVNSSMTRKARGRVASRPRLHVVPAARRGRPSKMDVSYAYWQPCMSAAQFAAAANISEPTARKFIEVFEQHAA